MATAFKTRVLSGAGTLLRTVSAASATFDVPRGSTAMTLHALVRCCAPCSSGGMQTCPQPLEQHSNPSSQSAWPTHASTHMPTELGSGCGHASSGRVLELLFCSNDADTATIEVATSDKRGNHMVLFLAATSDIYNQAYVAEKLYIDMA
mmetsp:Transcript_10543/g.23974  ORF Transcript_10543/g.23974 Transcript_10543/m.23974 type:complete len:149 (-) Transcript_10543:8-454(-)